MLELRAQDTIVMDVHDAIIAMVQSLENSRGSDRGTRYTAQLSWSMCAIMERSNMLVGFVSRWALLSTLEHVVDPIVLESV